MESTELVCEDDVSLLDDCVDGGDVFVVVFIVGRHWWLLRLRVG